MEFGTPAYWAAVASGAISWTQATDDNTMRQVRRDRAKTAPRRRHATPRELRPAPTPSRQYAPSMPTAFARDQRLTDTARRLLILLCAIAGHGDGIHTTKAGLAGALGRHPKTVQAALGLLERCEYINRATWRHASGRNRGLVIAIGVPARPFWRGGMGVPALPPLKANENKERYDRTITASQAGTLRPPDHNASIGTLSPW